MSKRSISVITTNENIKALYFYQKINIESQTLF